jgi:modulator of FtsH protease HflC
MQKPITILVVLTALLALAYSCIFEVSESEYAIVARFGDPSRVIDEPGLHCMWPPPVDSLIRIDRRIHVLDPAPAEYLTSEKKNVLVDFFTAWSVVDPRKYLVTVADQHGAEARLVDIVRSEVGSILGQHPLDVLVWTPGGENVGGIEETTGTSPTEKPEMGMEEVMRRITANTAVKALEGFGIEVSAVRIKRLNFPRQNKQAVFQRMEAERERIAMLYRSEGTETSEKIKARARLDEVRLISEAGRRAEEIRGEADAEASRIYAEAYGADPDFYEFIRSLETYRKIIRENSTIVIPSQTPLLRVLEDPETWIGGAGEGIGGAGEGEEDR